MLTLEQKQLLKADILADPILAEWAATGHMASEIADAYNLAAQPAWVVWRTSVTAEEWAMAIIGGGGAAQLDALTGSKREALLWACDRTLNPSDPEVRAALDDFCGSQNNLKGAVVAAQKRNATRAEKLFSSGTGTTLAPATMGFEGDLSYQDVEQALAS